MVNPSEHIPTVSIGLPVYNGAAHIGEAIESILKQDFDDFELIIVDNASTDNTVEICEEFVAKDPRVTLHRNEKNLGASPNFNKAFHLSRGKYFKWLAYDDWVEPSYLRKCVELLDSRPDVSLCQTLTTIYTEDGEFVRNYPERIKAMSDDPRSRFMSILRDVTQLYQVFGVMRRDMLAETMLIGSNPAADHTTVAEMALRGKIYMIQEHLNANRNTKSVRTARDERNWWDASKRKGHRPKYTLLLLQHLKAIRNSDLSRRQKWLLSTQTLRYFATCRRFAVVRETRLNLAAVMQFR